jgi:hypothetical protein
VYIQLISNKAYSLLHQDQRFPSGPELCGTPLWGIKQPLSTLAIPVSNRISIKHSAIRSSKSPNPKAKAHRRRLDLLGAAGAASHLNTASHRITSHLFSSLPSPPLPSPPSSWPAQSSGCRRWVWPHPSGLFLTEHALFRRAACTSEIIQTVAKQ